MGFSSAGMGWAIKPQTIKKIPSMHSVRGGNGLFPGIWGLGALSPMDFPLGRHEAKLAAVTLFASGSGGEMSPMRLTAYYVCIYFLCTIITYIIVSHVRSSG
jgi:hypothetical protein